MLNISIRKGSHLSEYTILSFGNEDLLTILCNLIILPNVILTIVY